MFNLSIHFIKQVGQFVSPHKRWPHLYSEPKSGPAEFLTGDRGDSKGQQREKCFHLMTSSCQGNPYIILYVVKARRPFNQQTFPSIYYTSICPSFVTIVCGSVGNAYSSYLDPFQERTLRIICGSPQRTRQLSLYSALKLFQF